LADWDIDGDVKNVWIAGCGTIAPLMFGRRNPDVAFYATDLSTKALTRLRWRLNIFGIRNVKLSVEDLFESAYQEIFDAIDCYGVLHHTVSPKKALESMAKALRPGGVLRLMVYSRDARYEIESLRKEIVDKGLKDISMIEKIIKDRGLKRIREFLTRNGVADALLNPIVSTFDRESFSQLLESQPRLKTLKVSSSGNFVAFLKKT